MQIALFGGAFDPPHVGHKLVADQLIKTQTVDEVWFVPVFQHPWADRLGKYHLSEYADRVAMLELLLGEHQSIAHYRSVSYTYDTLEYFSAQHPENTFSWVMGTEYVSKFDDFLSVHPGLSNYHFFIYPRAGYPAHELAANMELLTSVPEIEASSTQVRQLVREGASIDHAVIPEVAAYIQRGQLYIGGRAAEGADAER